MGRWPAAIQRATHAITLGAKPVVGAINGWAVGGGFEWAINCDFPIWGRSAKGFFPEVSLNLFVTGAVTTLLPALVGLNKAREMLMLGERYEAGELGDIGLAWRVVEDAALMEEARGVAARCEVLLAWRDAIADHAPDIAEALCVDTGRHLMAQLETKSVQDWIDYWVGRAPQLITEGGAGESRLAPTVSWRHRLKPYPVVGIISPWNVPLILGLIDLVPALLAGCTVLLKPSEVTPRFAEPLMRSIEDVPGLGDVVDIVTGGAETGQAMVNHADAICFTGSVPTGRRVAAHAAENFIPAFLELGGKDPAIVMPSADLDNATTAILRSAAGMTGQACQSLERIYVHESVFDEFLERLIDKARAIEPNWPDLHSGHLGPFIFPPQGEKVKAQIEDAVARGATVHCGGLENHGGWWCRPVVRKGMPTRRVL